MAFNLQSAYAQQQAGDPDQDQDQDSSQQQAPPDLTIPADIAAQIAQAIQGNDCATVCKLMAAVISQGQAQPQ
jgi:hypothetical protein